MIFHDVSKTWCGFCKSVKQLLSQLGASYKVIELDEESKYTVLACPEKFKLLLSSFFRSLYFTLYFSSYQAQHSMVALYDFPFKLKSHVTVYQ